jgi:putative membrane protein
MSHLSLEFRTKLLIAFAVWWIIWAYKPVHFSDWVLENVLTLAFVLLLVLTRNSFRLSNVSYSLIFVFLCLHTIGSHYTYAEVPYDSWSRSLGFSVNELLGFERNQFDRLVHFLFGFLLCYPVREAFMRIVHAKGAWSYYLPLELVMSLSMLYELIEWLVAMTFGGDLGMAYLGTQGDIWDAHKDMGLASVGAALGMMIVAGINWKFNRDFMAELRDSLKVERTIPLGEVKLKEYKQRDAGEETQ